MECCGDKRFARHTDSRIQACEPYQVLVASNSIYFDIGDMSHTVWYARIFKYSVAEAGRDAFRVWSEGGFVQKGRPEFGGNVAKAKGASDASALYVLIANTVSTGSGSVVGQQCDKKSICPCPVLRQIGYGTRPMLRTNCVRRAEPLDHLNGEWGHHNGALVIEAKLPSRRCVVCLMDWQRNFGLEKGRDCVFIRTKWLCADYRRLSRNIYSYRIRIHNRLMLISNSNKQDAYFIPFNIPAHIHWDQPHFQITISPLICL